MESSTLVGNLINSVKEHSRAFGIAGAVIGAILVIYYCGSIRFYPSGLTMADTLFFLWVVVVFGFYYSVVAFAFFIASMFWVTIFSKPINLFLKFIKVQNKIVVPLPKSDWLTILVGGLISNFYIISVSYFKNHSFMAIFGSLFLIGFIYTLIEYIGKRTESGVKSLESSDDTIKTNPMDPKTVKNIFYVLIYVAPLLFAQVGGGITRTTFETMGVRQESINLHIEAKDYRSILESYKKQGLIADLECNEVCDIKNVNVLFTNIGTNTKVELYGENGSLQVVLPTNVIKLTVKTKPNKSSKPDAEKRAAS